MRPMRDSRGQASIDWIVVVGVVTVALVVAGSVVSAASIAAIVERQYARALCIVSHGDCNEDRVPCTVTSDTEMKDTSVNLAIVKVSHGTTLLIERRSDGTYRVTRSHDSGLGLEGGLGADLSFSGLGLKLAIGGEARASVLAHLGKGETWLAHSQAQADYDAALLSLHRHPQGAPVQRYSQSGRLTSFNGSLTVAQGRLAVAISQDDIDGTRTDADGDTTIYFRKRIDADASVQFGASLAGVGLTGVQSTDYALKTDRTGRPIDFEVFSVGRLAAGAGLPGLQGGPATVSGRASAGDAYEYERHLDLSDPDNLAAAQAFMKAHADPGDFAAAAIAIRAMAARLAVDSVDQSRVYDLHQSAGGVSGHAALGIKVGGAYKQTSVDMKLHDARVRGPDGIWTRRDDCLAT